MSEWQRNAAGKQSVILLAVALVCCGFAAKTAAARAETKRPASMPAEEEQTEPTDPWAPFRLLEGKWEGAVDGIFGQGAAHRSYEFILDGKFVHMRHASVRLPQEKSPKGDHHREITVYSFDSERETIVMRAFIVEGYVLRYTCEVEPKRFVCNTESVEGGTGMQARVTIEIADGYRFEETFELASPGQELKVFFTNSWTRVPDLGD
jgi:hypothetical protein